MTDDRGPEIESEPLLAVSNLTVSYRNRDGSMMAAVRGVNFNLQKGRVLGLVGESGSGKSSVARAITQLESYEGTVLFRGEDLSAASRRRLRKLRAGFQIVFQDSLAAMDPRQTVGQALERPLRVQHVGTSTTRRARALELIELVGLDESFLNRAPSTLSGGQRQRVNIARALALAPALLVCDEPVSALDVSIQAQILTLLGDLRDRLGLTILFISHDLAVVRHFCDDVAVMYHGDIVEEGTVDEVLFNPQNPYTKKLLAAASDVVQLPQSQTE